MHSKDLRILEIDGKFVVAIHRNQAWSQLTWHHTRADAQRDLAILSLAAPSLVVGRAERGKEAGDELSGRNLRAETDRSFSTRARNDQHR
jgi:hypothetical protein